MTRLIFSPEVEALCTIDAIFTPSLENRIEKHERSLDKSFDVQFALALCQTRALCASKAETPLAAVTHCRRILEILERVARRLDWDWLKWREHGYYDLPDRTWALPALDFSIRNAPHVQLLLPTLRAIYRMGWRALPLAATLRAAETKSSLGLLSDSLACLERVDKEPSELLVVAVERLQDVRYFFRGNNSPDYSIGVEADAALTMAELLPHLKDGDPGRRARAACLLGLKFDLDPLVRPAIARALHDRNVAVRAMAVQSLADLVERNPTHCDTAHRSCIDCMIEMLHTDRSYHGRGAAALALGKVLAAVAKNGPDGVSIKESLTKSLDDANPRVRVRAAWAIAEFEDEVSDLLPKITGIHPHHFDDDGNALLSVAILRISAKQASTVVDVQQKVLTLLRTCTSATTRALLVRSLEVLPLETKVQERMALERLWLDDHIAVRRAARRVYERISADCHCDLVAVVDVPD